MYSNKKDWKAIAMKLFIMMLAAICFLQVVENIRIGFFFSKQILRGRDNNNYVRLTQPVAGTLILAKKILPQNAIVQISPNDGWGSDWVNANYFLYPFKVCRSVEDDSWTHLVDFNTAKTKTDQLPGKESDLSNFKGKKFELPNGATVYAKQGFDFNLPDDNTPLAQILKQEIKSGVDFHPEDVLPLYPIRGKSFLIFLGVVFLELFTGCLILKLIRLTAKDAGILYYIGTCYLLGFIYLTLPLWGFYVIGVTLNSANILTIWGALIILLAILVMVKFRGIFRLSLTHHVSGSPVNRDTVLKAGWKDKSLSYAVVFICCMLVLSYAAQAAYSPVCGWDPFTMWVMYAKMIVSNQFLKPGIGGDQYPMLWPVHSAIMFAFNGDIDHDEFVQWTMALLILATASQIFGALTLLKVNAMWSAVTLILYFLFFPPMVAPFAETGLSALVAGVVAAAVGWLKLPGKRGFLISSLLMAVGLASFKMEGGIASIFIGIALAAASEGSLLSRKNWWLIAVFFFPSLIEAAWIIYQKHNMLIGNGGQFAHLMDGGLLELAHKVYVIIRTSYIHILSAHPMYSLAAGFALAVFLQKTVKRVSREEMFLMIFSLGMILFIGLSLLGWETKNISAWYIQTAPRLILHAWPSVIVLVGSRLWGGHDMQAGDSL
ncbi:hypothetical protein [Candidatus Magnetominusculus dajiuhuensis]|uniref:hypothetical protein n=1 Tax=Candidatus Magnetominusculus dajiuhuensis TaxID=3137712 RepID=UPI003B436050